jgi:hypothetical protein
MIRLADTGETPAVDFYLFRGKVRELGESSSAASTSTILEKKMNVPDPKKHPNYENHKKIMKLILTAFKPALFAGNYTAAGGVLFELVQICMDAEGVPREMQAAMAGQAVQNAMESRKPKPVVQAASGEEVNRFGKGR